MMQNPLRPLGIGEILDSAFTLYRRHFVVLVTTALVASLPLALLGIYFEQLAVEVGQESVLQSGFLGIAAGVVMIAETLLVTGALTYQFAEAYGGREVRLGAGLRQSIRAILPLTGSALLVGAVIGGAVLAIVLIMG